MLRADEETQPRRTLLHRRVDDLLHVDAAAVEGGREPAGLERTVRDRGNDRKAGAEPRVDAESARQLEEPAAALAQHLGALRLTAQDPQRRERRGGDRRRHADAVEESGCGALEMLDQGALAGDIAATGGERLAESSHPDVDITALQPEVLLDTEAAAAHHAERVRLVHHEEGAMAALDVHEAGQVGKVAVHAVDAL